MSGGRRLLYVFPEPLPLDRARGIQTTYTVRALAEQGVDVLLVHVPAGSDPFAECALEKPGKVELLPVSRRLAWPLHGMHSNRLFSSRLVRSVPWPEIGAVFTRHLKIARALLERCPDLPLVYEAHEVFTDTAPEARRAQIATLESFVVEKAAAVVANSHATARRLKQRHASDVTVQVIPNGVDYPATLPEKSWARAREHVIYAGSFFGWKGVGDLIAAASELPGFRIELIGGDSESIARLRSRASHDGAELVFTGRVAHQAVAQALAGACIAVLPNRADTDSTFTSPIKLFEYMASGCSIVASDLPALREVLESDEAMWTRAGDPHALADAIRTLAADPPSARAMAARVREKAKRYTWGARGAALASLVRPFLT